MKDKVMVVLCYSCVWKLPRYPWKRNQANSSSPFVCRVFFPREAIFLKWEASLFIENLEKKIHNMTCFLILYLHLDILPIYLILSYCDFSELSFTKQTKRNQKKLSITKFFFLNYKFLLYLMLFNREIKELSVTMYSFFISRRRSI